MAYSTLSGLEREKLRTSIPSRDKFHIFIKPECLCVNERIPNCENIAFIPYYGFRSNNVYLNHGKRFNVGIMNLSDRRADAEIYIDGIQIGIFRLNKYSYNFQLERPVHSNKGFTFISKNSKEALDSGINESLNCKLGLITVYIRPEDTSYKYMPTYRLSNANEVETFYPASANVSRSKSESICKTSSANVPSEDSEPVYGAACAPLSAETESAPNSDTVDTVDTPMQPKGLSVESDYSSPAEKVLSTGFTLLGKASTQKFSETQEMHTKGQHIYTITLQAGNCECNSIFYINNLERFMPCQFKDL